MDPEITVQLTKNQYMTLYHQSLILEALEAAGVDNWEGYDMVDWMAIEEEVKKEEDAIDG